MSKLEAVKGFLRRWFLPFPFYILLGVVLGALVAVPAVPRPKVAVLNISGALTDPALTDDILDTLRKAGNNPGIKAVVLNIDSPGGGASQVEPIYLEVLRLRQRKPVVAVVGSIAASGGYYIAIAASHIYVQPTSQVGSIGVWSNLPAPEDLNDNIMPSGLFKLTGGSKRKAIADLELVRQEFVSAVMTQRGERLKLSDGEISLASLYSGVEAVKNGLVDEIGPSTVAIEKAASMAGLRNYDVFRLVTITPLPTFFFSDFGQSKSQAGSAPAYYFLYYESK